MVPRLRPSSSRRDFLGAAGAGLLGAALPGAPLAARPLAAPLGVQLYTVRAQLQTDFDATLAAIARIGYRQLEFAGFFGRSPAEIRRITDALELRCLSAHYSAAELDSDLPAIIELAHALDLRYVHCASPMARDPERVRGLSWAQTMAALDLEDWRANAQLFNRVGEQMRRAGLLFGYHNHHVEFRRFGAVVAYDELLRLTDPRWVRMQLDCGWAAAAGADPVRYLSTHPGRFSSLHLKDIIAVPPDGEADRTVTTEVGAGIIDWQAVLRAAQRAGVAAYFVEQEPPYRRPALESLAISFRNLRRLEL